MAIQVYGARMGRADADEAEVGILVDTVTWVAFGPIFRAGPEDAEAFLDWLSERGRSDARKLGPADLANYAIAWEDVPDAERLDRHEAASSGIPYREWCERREQARAYDDAIDREDAEASAQNRNRPHPEG